MEKDDFFANEQSAIMEGACDVRIELQHGGQTTVLKPKTALKADEVVDAIVIRAKSLNEFYEKQMQICDKEVLFSLHLKATMTKVADPI